MEYKVETLGQGEKTRIRSTPVYSYPAHIHTYCEMILYEPFDGEITVNEQRIKTDSCCVILMAPLDLHRVCVRRENGAKFIKVELNTDKIERSALVRNLEPDAFLRRVFEEITHSTQDESYMNLLIDTAIHIIQQTGQIIPPMADSPANQLAMQAVKTIYENYFKPITLASTAKKLFVSPQYLSKVFKNRIGAGFSRFLSELRLSRSADLLIRTQRSIPEICFDCGFRNVSHFLRRFKQRFGFTPLEYRETARKAHNRQENLVP